MPPKGTAPMQYGIIEGRPDFADHKYGHTFAKTFPPYVFGVRGVSCLVHKIRSVEMRWWDLDAGGHNLVQLVNPIMWAHTTCSQFFRLEGAVSRTCRIPAPDALLCGRCHGEGATFPKRSNGRAKVSGLTRQEAHVKLGCVVQGY